MRYHPTQASLTGQVVRKQRIGSFLPAKSMLARKVHPSIPELISIKPGNGVTTTFRECLFMVCTATSLRLKVPFFLVAVERSFFPLETIAASKPSRMLERGPIDTVTSTCFV